MKRARAMTEAADSALEVRFHAVGVPSSPEARLRKALELSDLAVRMLRARFRREHPRWTEAELDAAIHEWRASRPMPFDGPEYGVREP